MELLLIFLAVWVVLALLGMSEPSGFEFPVVTFLIAILIGALIVF